MNLSKNIHLCHLNIHGTWYVCSGGSLVSGIGGRGRGEDDCYRAFQYLTVSCKPAIGHVQDISIPDSFMYTCCRSCIGNFNT